MYSGALGTTGGVGGTLFAGGAGSAPSGAAATLPFTGFGAIELAIAGFVLLAAGQATARMLPRLHRAKCAVPSGSPQRLA